MKEDSFADFWSKVEADYMKFKSRKPVDFPKDLKGCHSVKFYGLRFSLAGYEWKDRYKMIGIYIDTPAFDQVTMDKSATTDILSTIGGTFGLLTGFSLISAVEIVYFLGKFLMSFVTRDKKQK